MPLALLISDFQILLLMSIRILVLLSFVPIVSASHTPFFVRVVLAGLVAFVIKYINGVYVFDAPTTLGEFLLLLTTEAIIGAIIGFYIQIVFMFLNGLTEFFSTLMGLRAVQVLNPLTGISSEVITQFISIIVMIVFISSYTLQKIFFTAIAQSFYVINANSLIGNMDKSMLGFVFFSFAKLFERAFIISLPVFISLLIVNVGLGLYGKVAPQINLLVLGLPLQLGAGLILLFFFLPPIVHGIEATFDNMIQYIGTFMKSVAL